MSRRIFRGAFQAPVPELMTRADNIRPYRLTARAHNVRPYMAIFSVNLIFFLRCVIMCFGKRLTMSIGDEI